MAPVSRPSVRRIAAILVLLGGGVSALLWFLSRDDRAVSLTDGERTWLTRSARKSLLCFNADFPPIEFTNADGAFIGMGADVFRLIERRLGQTFPRKVVRSWPKHLAALRDGSCALAPTIVQTDDRRRYVRFTTPYARVPVVIIGEQRLGHNLSLADLKGLKVAVVADFATEGHVRRHGRGLKLKRVEDVQAGVRAVAFRQVDAFVGNLASAVHFIHKNGITNLQVVGEANYDFVFRIAVSRRYPELHSAIQKALDDISPGQLEKIRKRWVSLRQGLSPQLRRLLWIIAVFLLLLVTSLVLISRALKRRLDDKVEHLDAAQGELARSEERFRTLFRLAPIPLAELSREGQILQMNEAMERSLHYSAETTPDLERWMDRACPDADQRLRALELWRRTLAGDPVENEEAQFERADGRVRYCLVSTALAQDHALVAFVDIDERKRMEQELESSKERFSTLFELSPFSCVINDMEGRFVLANEFFLESVGRAREEVIGRTMEEIGQTITAADRMKVIEAFKRDEAFPLQEMEVTTHGRTRSSLVASRIIDWGQERAIITATVDITEKKEALQQLQDKEESLRVTLDAIGDAVITTDTKGLVTRMNPVAEELTGWSKDSASGEALQEVFEVSSADDRLPRRSPVADVLASGAAVDHTENLALTAKDGRRVRIAAAAAPLRSDAGVNVGAVLVFRDVSEEHAVQEQLRQSQKMQAVGQLAGGVAHDFNNMLFAITGAVELLEELLEGDEEREYLDMIQNAAERATDLVSKLLTFSRKDHATKLPIDAHAPIRDALALLERTVDPRIEVEATLMPEPIEVLGDHTLLQSAMLNLFINATHAMAEGGELHVGSRLLDLDEDGCAAIDLELRPGRFVEIEVRDTGCGIKPADLEHIFEPFFSTKEQGRGTGLGLSAVFGTVRAHDGAITVYSEPAVGTCFRVLLPTSETQPWAAASQSFPTMEGPPSSEDIAGQARVLVVDDEPMVRHVTSKTLRAMGHLVETAEDGQQALELMLDEKRRFDLVILDMVMPRMNGRQCFEALAAAGMEVPVLLVSGFAREEDAAAMQEQGLAGFLRKPFRRSELVEATRRALGRAPLTRD